MQDLTLAPFDPRAFPCLAICLLLVAHNDRLAALDATRG